MNLKQLRKSKKLTQIEAAELCGLSRKGYQNLEEGRNKKKNSQTFQYCVARLEEYASSVSLSHLSKKETSKGLVNYFLSSGSSFLYILNKDGVALLCSLSLSEFDLVALENELEARFGKEIKVFPLEKIDRGTLVSFLKDGTRLYPKAEDH
jgi:transcriptional regulator with XRE-family HTH domain